MSLQSEIVEKETKKSNLFKKYIIKKGKWGVLILVVILAALIGVRTVIYFDNKTTKIGFEDIGEFATQDAYCTELSIIDNSRDLFGVSIPFTQSKYIYSYDVIIKAGFDFGEIEWNKNDNIIEVKLPEGKVLSSEIDLDSFKVYHEKESVFNKITMSENNESLRGLKEKAEEDAIANGLLKNARSNAETVLIEFFAKEYDLDKYEIVFKDK
ncbi:DUF4230 domain-containing protein [Clostridium sartagoforme]|uniref:DUF4230 domain-containing protein n=1 Tax=Clostridium sartagoforme TaxID=84031 RepID=A0A4S2DKP2_9CLOT|nr:DUF4230 domain-containing protein [Clostridium sartagoforme]TGY42799.1 DUF4230 domain-containing protein [Clostridium sartagoforme]